MRIPVILLSLSFIGCALLQKKEETPQKKEEAPIRILDDSQIIVEKIDALIGEPDASRVLGTRSHKVSHEKDKEERTLEFVTYSIKRVKDNLLLEVKFSIAIYRGKETYKAVIKSDSYVTRSINPMIEEVEIRSGDKKEFLKKLQISLQKMN